MKNSTKTPKILAWYEADIINFFVTVKRWSQVLSTIAEKQPKISHDIRQTCKHYNKNLSWRYFKILAQSPWVQHFSIATFDCNSINHVSQSESQIPNPSAIWLDSIAQLWALTTWRCRNLAKQHHTLNRTWIKVGFMTLGQRSGVL